MFCWGWLPTIREDVSFLNKVDLKLYEVNNLSIIALQYLGSDEYYNNSKIMYSFNPQQQQEYYFYTKKIIENNLTVASAVVCSTLRPNWQFLWTNRHSDLSYHRSTQLPHKLYQKSSLKSCKVEKLGFQSFLVKLLIYG